MPTAQAKKATLSARVLKAMSMFTGLQAFTIICSVVKMKLVALWLHADGVGLFGIYQSVADTLGTLTDLGIRQSAVRDVASSRGARERMQLVAQVVRRWSLMAGLLGAVIMAGASPLFSRLIFGDMSHVWGFALLSVAMLFNSMAGGDQALLQGSGRLKALARGSLIGTAAGLLLSIPLFYFLGESSVALSITVYSLAIFVSISLVKLPAKPSTNPGLRRIWNEGKGFARLGLCMAFSAFITGLAHTLFVGLLNYKAGTAQVGYVQAGDTILVKYIGLIFTAIGTEFYPRLAAARRLRAMQTFVNHEALLLLTVLTPLLLLFFMLRSEVVRLLYSSDFMAIIPFITLGALSSLPKAVSWCMAFTIICRGDGRIYILTEALDALVSVPLCYFAFINYGMTGLGVAYILWYIIYMLITGSVYYGRYRLRLYPLTWLSTLLSSLICLGGIAAMEYAPKALAWPLLALVALAYIFPLRRMIKR